MYEPVEKTPEKKSQIEVNGVSQRQNSQAPTYGFVDKRPEAIQMRKLRELAKNSPQNAKLRDLHHLAAANSVTQKKQIGNKCSGFEANRGKVPVYNGLIQRVIVYKAKKRVTDHDYEAIADAIHANSDISILREMMDKEDKEWSIKEVMKEFSITEQSVNWGEEPKDGTKEDLTENDVIINGVKEIDEERERLMKRWYEDQGKTITKWDNLIAAIPDDKIFPPNLQKTFKEVKLYIRKLQSVTAPEHEELNSEINEMRQARQNMNKLAQNLSKKVKERLEDAGAPAYNHTNPRTWVMAGYLKFNRGTSKVEIEAYDKTAGKLHLDPIKEGAKADQHGKCQVGKALHCHLNSGNGGLAFHYERDANTGEVIGVIDDYAKSRPSGKNTFNWEKSNVTGYVPSQKV